MADNIQVIDDEGDVILVVGDVGSDVKQTKLKVSSAMLSRASPVFKTLFGPHFSEGQPKRSPESPIEITLPDDSPIGMTRLCDLIHLREVSEFMRQHIKGLPGKSPQSEKLLHFAIASDKYDVVGRLQLQSQGMLLGWLKQANISPSETNAAVLWGNAVAASYLLNSPRAFEESTLRFINCGLPKASVILKELCGQVLPTKVLLALQERRCPDGTATKGLCLVCVRADSGISDYCTKH